MRRSLYSGSRGLGSDLRSWMPLALANCLLLLSSCSTSSEHVAAVTPQSAKTASTAQVSLRLILPKKIAPATNAHGALRSPKYISTSTSSLRVTVTSQLGVTSPPFVFTCSVGSCSGTLAAPVGNDTFALTLYDGAAATGNALAISQSQAVAVAPSVANTINLTANPVVHDVAISLGGNATIAAGTPMTAPLSITVHDQDGNIVTGPGSYVDANGNPLTLTVSSVDATAGGSGAFSVIGSGQLTAAGQTVSLQYNGRWLDHSTVTVTPSQPIAVAITPVTMTTTPTVTEYPVSGNPHGLTVGPDGNIWFTEFMGDSIDQISPDGSGWVRHPCACSEPHYIVTGPDGKLWVTEYLGNAIDTYSLSGVFTQILGGQAGLVRVIDGPGGKLWYATETARNIGAVTTAGMSATYPTGDQLRGIGNGPDGNVWYLDDTTNSIGSISPTGSFLANYALTGSIGSSDSIVFAADGKLWFSQHDSDVIVSMTTAGVMTRHNLQAGAAPRNITVGADGNLWFTEDGAASIGRITTGGTLTEYGMADGITAGSQPLDIIEGPDGNIWFTEYFGNNVAKFVL